MSTLKETVKMKLKPYKSGMLLSLGLAGAITLAGCAQLDVVGEAAVDSFDKLVGLTLVETQTVDGISYWKISTPDAKAFYLASDASSAADAMLTVSAKPFIQAGLAVDQLEGWLYDAEQDTLTWQVDLTDKAYDTKAADVPQEAFKALIGANRDAIGYHKALDHYGITLGGGNMFEWAKDDTTNDKDMVLVLNPEPFIKAGVDPQKVDGWVFAKVEVMDEKNNPIQVDKFLSPYELSK